jgi:DNA-directed RNA polymerase specialized sigma24 family protein
MDPTLEAALKDSEIDLVIAKAVAHAECRLRAGRWRGQSASVSSTKALAGGGYTATDFADEAMGQLITGQRSYKVGLNLLDNLKRTINSLIWNHRRRVENSTLFDPGEVSEPDEDPVLQSPDPLAKPDDQALDAERKKHREELYAKLKDHFKDESDLIEILTAMELETTKSGAIADLLGWPVEKVYEAKRKLQKRTKELFGVQNYEELEHKLI